MQLTGQQRKIVLAAFLGWALDALALVAGIVALCVAVVIRFSPERRGGVMTVTDPSPA